MTTSKTDTGFMDISLKSMPKSLIEFIDNLAKIHRRSRSAEIVTLLETMKKMTLGTLAKEGYVKLHTDGTYELTTKGKEAVREKLKEKR